jgi:hypothetical protein
MDNFDDIINMPHHVSQRHPQMSMWNRAAQFAPFAALTGYEDSIKESAEENEKLFEEINNQQHKTINEDEINQNDAGYTDDSYVVR